jgi:hypothetical protein
MTKEDGRLGMLKLWLMVFPPFYEVGLRLFARDMVRSWREGYLEKSDLSEALEVVGDQRETVWKSFLEEYARDEGGIWTRLRWIVSRYSKM